MQTRKVLVVVALVSASIAMAARDGITLRKALTTGTEKYHMLTTSKQTISIAGADQDMAMTSVASYSFKIGAVDAAGGSAQADLTTKVEKVDFDGPLAEAMSGQKDKLLISTTVSGKLDSRNRFNTDTAKKIDPRSVILGASTASFVSPLVEFPEVPVNVGDTWDVKVPKSPLTTKEDQKLTAKLVGEKDVDGKSVYVVSVTGTVKSNVDIGEIMKGNPVPELEAIGATDMIITGSTDVSGEAIVDKATGQTLTMTIKLNTKEEATSSALGDTKIPLTGVSTIKYTLDK